MGDPVFNYQICVRLEEIHASVNEYNYSCIGCMWFYENATVYKHTTYTYGTSITQTYLPVFIRL